MFVLFDTNNFIFVACYAAFSYICNLKNRYVYEKNYFIPGVALV